MNSLIEKSTIKKLLLNQGQQFASGRVRTDYLLEEMSLIGFVPFSEFWDNICYDTGINMSTNLYVTPHLLRPSDRNKPIPIFKCISKAQGEKYVIDGNFMIDSIIDKIPNNVFEKVKYKECKKGFNGSSLKNLLIYDKSLYRDLSEKGVIEQPSNETPITYIGDENDLELSDGIGKIKFISNDFLCLCAYMNKVTGLPSYIILPSDRTIRVLPEENE